MIKPIIAFVIFQLLLFSVFLLSQKNEKKASHRILGLFFLTLGINMFQAFCFYNVDYFLDKCPHLFFIGSPFAFLYAPLFFYYVKALTSYKFSLRKEDLIHIIPFVIMLVYFTAAYYVHSAETKRHLFQTSGIISPVQWRALTALLHFQILFYVVLSVSTIRQYRKKMKNEYASIENINYSWLKWLFIGICFLWIIDLSRFITGLFNPGIRMIFEIILYTGFVCLCYWIIYKAVKQPRIFTEFENKTSPRKSSLSEASRNRYLKKLSSFMEIEKPYLNPDITLTDLSKRLSIPHRSLSEVINNNLGQNFYDFINAYRIKESQRLLIDESAHYKTILEVLYEVGYNSKSSFHNAFKKYTGMTPSQYKKIHCN